MPVRWQYPHEHTEKVGTSLNMVLDPNLERVIVHAMRQARKDQQVAVGQAPIQGRGEKVTVTLRDPMTGEAEEVSVRRAGPVPRDLIQRAIAEDREALESLAPHDGPITGT